MDDIESLHIKISKLVDEMHTMAINLPDIADLPWLYEGCKDISIWTDAIELFNVKAEMLNELTKIMEKAIQDRQTIVKGER